MILGSKHVGAIFKRFNVKFYISALVGMIIKMTSISNCGIALCETPNFNFGADSSLWVTFFFFFKKKSKAVDKFCCVETRRRIVSTCK